LLTILATLAKRIYRCRLGLELLIQDQANWTTLMQQLTAPNIQIDSIHCRAICEEVGHRLSKLLETEVAELPPQLKMQLIDFVRKKMRRQSFRRSMTWHCARMHKASSP
jgi:hypothetical protein